MVGVSRVISGAHFPHDVALGALIGFVGLFATYDGGWWMWSPACHFAVAAFTFGVSWSARGSNGLIPTLLVKEGVESCGLSLGMAVSLLALQSAGHDVAASGADAGQVLSSVLHTVSLSTGVAGILLVGLVDAVGSWRRHSYPGGLVTVFGLLELVLYSAALVVVTAVVVPLLLPVALSALL